MAGASAREDPYAVGVTFLSPGSRSAPWVIRWAPIDTPKGFYEWDVGTDPDL